MFSDAVTVIGESVTIAGKYGIWWYQASTGERLALCDDTETAADEVSAILTPWVSMALAYRTR
ncbi:hypothetical protein [Actinomadura sp. GTD37]|uniref:hypothetical protein n=1 Tax=Actinomadura sp. GTD37 TaxID=1778030 RepID=UPI0035C20863